MSAMERFRRWRPRWPMLIWWLGTYAIGASLAYNLWFAQPVGGEGFRSTWFYRYGDPWLWWLLLPAIFSWRRWLAVDRVRWWTLLLGHLAAAAAVTVLVFLLRAMLLLVSNQLPLEFFREVVRDIADPVAALWLVGAYVALVVPAYALDFYRRWRAEQREAAELKLVNAQIETRLVRANLDALKMQLHPHFLFNALNSVTALIRRERTEEAEEVISKLSALLRRALGHKQEQIVSLDEELEFLDDYFAIERIRFQDRLEVQFDIATDCRDARVPSLLLQPLVENAMKHGFSRLPEARLLRLRAWRDHDELRLELYNDGPPLAGEVSVHGTGIGLRNTRARLEMIYAGRASLRLTSTPPGGVTATIVLPYSTPAP